MQMVDITKTPSEEDIENVKKLRSETGFGMMVCKHYYYDNNCDYSQAKEALRRYRNSGCII